VWSKSDAARAPAWRDVDPSVNLTEPEPYEQRYLGSILLRIQSLTKEADGQFAAVALTETNGHEIVQISDREARSIQIEFESELPRIAASAAVGFPVPDAIPFEIGERPSAEGGQQTCPNCPHPMAMHTSMGCRECGCSRPS
jgi:hypothetical protein